MSAQLQVGDIVWARNLCKAFWPGKIAKLEPEDASRVFVDFFSGGSGRPPKGLWREISQVVAFQASKEDPVFEAQHLNKAYSLAKVAFLIRPEQKRAALKLTQVQDRPTLPPVVEPPVVASKEAPKTKGGKRGRPSKKVVTPLKIDPHFVSKGEARIMFEKLTADLALSKVQLCSDDLAILEQGCGNEEDDIDEDAKATLAQDNLRFLDDLDSDDDDNNNKENDSDWSPDFGGNRRKQSGSFFLFKNCGKRKAFTPLVQHPVISDEPCEYEKIQEKRREEQRKMLESMRLASFALSRSFEPNMAKKAAKAAQRRRESAPTRIQPKRDRTRLNSTGSSQISSEWSTPRKRSIFDEDVYESEDYVAAKRGRTSGSHLARWKASDSDTLDVNDVTEAMLDNVSDFVSEKIYDQSKGTSCHQCRQKTLDMKTICRSGTCFGVRGKFCGVCLRNRYGEDAREALLDPNWSCPPCRKICNCSICRNRQGKSATGLLYSMATKLGFKSARDYLEHLSTKRATN